jgi:hypothetical protein
MGGNMEKTISSCGKLASNKKKGLAFRPPMLLKQLATCRNCSDWLSLYSYMTKEWELNKGQR